jgi:cell division protease FtsH
MMGGRVAEELAFNEKTSGAANDFDQATKIARYMVMDFGMSDLGPVNYGPHMDVTEWGKAYIEQQQISPEMQSAIDREVKRLLDEGYSRAVEILKKYRKKLDIIANELVKKETIEGEEFERLPSTRSRRSPLLTDR